METFIIRIDTAFTFKRITQLQRGILGRAGGGHLKKKVDQKNSLGLLWSLCLTLLSCVNGDSFLYFRLNLNRTLTPLAMFLSVTPSSHFPCCCTCLVVILVALVVCLSLFNLDFAVIRPSVVRRHGQADKDGLVLAAYNIDEPDAAILNKDGHITSDLGHGGPMSSGASVPRSGDMRTRTQLEDEQRGQMRSYLTHI